MTIEHLGIQAERMTDPHIMTAKARTWFESRTTGEQVRALFATAQAEVRIACGFFTICGWNMIRSSTRGKRVFILVGIDEPGEERARLSLVNDILRDLATGLTEDRRQAVRDLLLRMETGQVQMVDARALSHHAKLYIVDRLVAIVASANATARGLHDQIEAGTIQDDPVEVGRLVDQFDEYFALARDITQALIDALKRWLQFATPWDVYLKTMFDLEDLQEPSRSYKRPVSYQRDMIVRTLRQIRDHCGAMLVASTGLGKTVVAVNVALQLFDAGEITSVMVIGPKVVRQSWEQELGRARVHHEYFIHQTLDKPSSEHDANLGKFQEIVREDLDARWLLIIDECHVYRKRIGVRKTERGAFRRLLPIARERGCKILLLTGSPFSTDIGNLNDQLLLLPRTAPDRALWEVGDSRAWQVSASADFIELPVVSQLTTPHVAKYYGLQDEQGIYIAFGDERRYIPHVTLHRLDFPLPLEEEMAAAFRQRCFEVQDAYPLMKRIVEVQARVAWSSSPLELADVIGSVLDTPGGPRAYDMTFALGASARHSVLQPILDTLHALAYADDLKLKILIALLDMLHAKGEKAIVFCERQATVLYLEEALQATRAALRIFGTIVRRGSGRYALCPETQVTAAIKRFAPWANNAGGKYADTYDVFISTDAHGVGLNLQDAAVVINYDIDWTPIDPVQRAGRVLRPWHVPRTVEVYTFVPELSAKAGEALSAELEPVRKRWEKLLKRHDQSRRLIDLPVLPEAPRHEIYLPDIASRISMQSAEFDMDAAADMDISPYYQHTARLQANRSYAGSIPNDIVSAKLYVGQQPLVYVLLKYRGKHYWPIYDASANSLLPDRDIQKLLALIACEEGAAIAYTDFDEVERLNHACVEAWCKNHDAEPYEVIRICALYLLPDGGETSPKYWLGRTPL